MGTQGDSAVQQWEEFDESAANEEAEKMKEEGKGESRYLKLDVGRTVIRLLPPPVGIKSPFMVVYQHWIDLPSGSSVQFLCPAKMADPGQQMPCPACMRSDKLKRSGSDTDRDLGFSISAKRQVYCNVIKRGEEAKGPQVLRIGKGIHEELLKIRRDPDAGSNYTHPVKGNDIVIERTGTKKNDTEYSVRMVPKESPLGNMEWIGDQQNLGDMIIIPTVPQIEAMLRGEDKKKAAEKRSAANRPATTVEDDMTTAASSGTGGWKKTPQKDSNGDDIPF